MAVGDGLCKPNSKFKHERRRYILKSLQASTCLPPKFLYQFFIISGFRVKMLADRRNNMPYMHCPVRKRCLDYITDLKLKNWSEIIFRKKTNWYILMVYVPPSSTKQPIHHTCKAVQCKGKIILLHAVTDAQKHLLPFIKSWLLLTWKKLQLWGTVVICTAYWQHIFSICIPWSKPMESVRGSLRKNKPIVNRLHFTAQWSTAQRRQLDNKVTVLLDQNRNHWLQHWLLHWSATFQVLAFSWSYVTITYLKSFRPTHTVKANALTNQ